MTMALSYDISHQRTANGGGEGLTCAVAGSDCDLLVVGEGEEDFALLVPRFYVNVCRLAN